MEGFLFNKKRNSCFTSLKLNASKHQLLLKGKRNGNLLHLFKSLNGSKKLSRETRIMHTMQDARLLLTTSKLNLLM